MKIKFFALLSFALGCFIISGCQSPQNSQYTIGPSFFAEGDSIILEEVQSSIGTFEKGDVISIKGKYKLTEKSEAKLLLTITQTEGDGRSSVSPEQMTTIKGEKGNFELSINIQHKGYLHLSLRTASGEDRSFGALYFGTEEQMNDIANWDLASRYNK